MTVHGFIGQPWAFISMRIHAARCTVYDNIIFGYQFSSNLFIGDSVRLFVPAYPLSLQS